MKDKSNWIVLSVFSAIAAIAIYRHWDLHSHTRQSYQDNYDQQDRIIDKLEHRNDKLETIIKEGKAPPWAPMPRAEEDEE